MRAEWPDGRALAPAPLPGGGLSLGAGPALPCSRESRGPGSNPEPARIQHILAKLLNLSFRVAK